MNSFHLYATCIHFLAERKDSNMIYLCSRLGFETKTTYSFNCWEPKTSVVQLMEKRKKG